MKADQALDPVMCVTDDHRMLSLRCGDDIVASLAYYTGGSQHRPHSHEFSQLSFLLAGAMLERLEGVEHELYTAAMGFKPAGCEHEDVWGRQGTLIFSLKLPAEARGFPSAPGWSWHEHPETISALVKACLLAPSVAARNEAVGDLLATTDARGERFGTHAPSWLEEVRCRINDDPDDAAIEKLADDAGVDRAHLSRAFRRYYGVPPSVYRRQVLTGRAVQGVSQQRQCFSAVAANAGFSDQAHMNRTLRSQIGVSPGQLRRFLCG